MTEPSSSKSPSKSSAKFAVRIYDRHGRVVNAYGICEEHLSQDFLFQSWVTSGRPPRFKMGRGYATFTSLAGPMWEWPCERCEPEDAI